MSDTLQTHREPKLAPRRSLLASRAANTVRYSLMNLFILVGIAATAWGGIFGFTGLVFSFILMGYVDELFGDPGNKEERPPVWDCQAMLFLPLPLLILATLVTFNVTSAHGFGWLDA